MPLRISWLHEVVKRYPWHQLSSAYLLWNVGQSVSPWVLGKRLLSLRTLQLREAGQCQALLAGFLQRAKPSDHHPSKVKVREQDVAQSGPWQCLVMSAQFSTTSILCQDGPVPLTAPPTETWKNTQELHHHLPLAS